MWTCIFLLHLVFSFPSGQVSSTILAEYHIPHWLLNSFIDFLSGHASLSSLDWVTWTTPMISSLYWLSIWSCVLIHLGRVSQTMLTCSLLYWISFWSVVFIIFKPCYLDHTSDQGPLLAFILVMYLYHLHA